MVSYVTILLCMQCVCMVVQEGMEWFTFIILLNFRLISNSDQRRHTDSDVKVTSLHIPGGLCYTDQRAQTVISENPDH